MRTRRLTLALVLPILLSGVLAGCGDEGSSADATTGPLLTTQIALTVIEGPKQPTELCLGGVAHSLPPQCGGPRLVGFDWADHEGDFEEAAGVKFGDFLVEGWLDGKRFTVAKVVPADEVEVPDDDEPGRVTPCPEPEGGWRILDPDRATEATMEQTFTAAEGLAGYADAWMDSSRNPMTPEKAVTEADWMSMNDPEYVTVNVRVTRDRAGAEAALRKIWGGALCVSTAEHTDRELRDIQNELGDVPGFLGSEVEDGRVGIHVEFDDGALQEQVDATYGTGLVVISSALVPVTQ